MIEVSMSELFLFAWAALGTGFAAKYYAEAASLKFLMHKVVSDKKLRDELVAGYERHVREREGV